ncbi:hypothetical protein Hanom_Chr05g00468521 [Helianthus anomalus]
MDGVNEPDENGKISNLLDPDVEKQTFGRKICCGLAATVWLVSSTEVSPFSTLFDSVPEYKSNNLLPRVG